MKTVIRCFILVIFIFNSLSLHANMDLNIDKEIVPTGSEYMLRNYPDEPLLTIQVLGGVNKPGIYHVPGGTDVVTLMSLTGGIFSTADLSNIVLRKNKAKKITLIDLDKIIRDTASDPTQLHNGDVIFVNLKEDTIIPQITKVVTFASLILGLVVTGLVLSKDNN